MDMVDDVDDLPLGVILAIARIIEYVPTETIVAANKKRGSNSRLRLGDFKCGPSEIAFGDYSPNRYGWLLANLHRLVVPVPCKGALGLWTINPGTLRESLKRARLIPVL